MPKGNLLIIDDEQILLNCMSDILSNCADIIFTATDGLKGLDTIQREKIHCVVCDINMPEMNGVELIKALRERAINVPFIFYSGHGDKKLMLEAIKYGAFDFIDKPEFDGLEKTVPEGLFQGLHGHPSSNQGNYISPYRKLLAGI